MLLKQAILKAIVAGKITVAFRRWKRPTVKAGGLQRTPRGELAIDALDRVTLAHITPAGARLALRASADPHARGTGHRRHEARAHGRGEVVLRDLRRGGR